MSRNASTNIVKFMATDSGVQDPEAGLIWPYSEHVLNVRVSSSLFQYIFEKKINA